MIDVLHFQIEAKSGRNGQVAIIVPLSYESDEDYRKLLDTFGSDWQDESRAIDGLMFGYAPYDPDALRELCPVSEYLELLNERVSNG